MPISTTKLPFAWHQRYGVTEYNKLASSLTYPHTVCREYQATQASWKQLLRILAEIWRNTMQFAVNTEQLTYTQQQPVPGPVTALTQMLQRLPAVSLLTCLLRLPTMFINIFTLFTLNLSITKNENVKVRKVNKMHSKVMQRRL